ncbi:MAG: leucine--tRNA ligase [Candidatus Aenigmarchaeota archaeon]|nr:leucine--tRNA ligase [Candidatus Aenigmarchaeota archaeon]
MDWKKEWAKEGVFEPKAGKGKKWYMLFAYPTVSGTLHVGHARSYTLPDIVARYKRMKGFNVLFPLGFHATGIDCQKILDKCKKDLEEAKKYGIPQEEVKKFKTAIDVDRYLEGKMIEAFRDLGLSLDTREVVSTIQPQYNRFVQWQMRKLKEAGYLVQRDYRLAWCPNDQNPVSLDPAEADISEWKGAQIKDFVIIKFIGEGNIVFPAATLRPETLPGATNLWISPEGKYVKAKVGGEVWIVSEGAVEKLRLLDKKVEIIGSVYGKELLGKKVKSPFNGKELEVLAGGFVDSVQATGIVMSVPAHDPFDWINLNKAKPEIKPIQVVETEGLEADAAGELIKQNKITSTDDQKIEELVKEVYKLEWSRGKIMQSVPVLGGLAVPKAKARIVEWLKEKGKADAIYEFSVKPIHCRCGAEIVVKAVKGQWFIDYGNEKWKEKAKKCIETMDVYPKEYKAELPAIVDWLDARPCVRRRGLGTEFPFEKGWIVEALSDSTIYMAFYIVSKFFNEQKISLKDLTDEFFDFVFLGKGKPDKAVWKTIRKEFEYWYPLDLNAAGKEHKQVHFPFFIFHHTAIFPEKYWPRGISVNWHLIAYGKKMSKHLGNVIFWDQAIKKWGADTIRLYVAHGTNQWDDFDWKNEECDIYAKHVSNWLRLVGELKGKAGKSGIDKWIESRITRAVVEAGKALEAREIKKAADIIFFSVISDISWFKKRGGTGINKILLGTWIKALSLFMPFSAEEAWRILGEKGLVSEQEWAEFSDKDMEQEAEDGEEIVRETARDIEEIKRVSGIGKPKEIKIIVSHEWKYSVYGMYRNGKQLSEIMKIDSIRKQGNAAAGYFQKLQKKRPQQDLVFGSKKEFEYLNGAKNFFEKQFSAKITIEQAEKSKEQKAGNAEPGKPGILIS